MNIGSDDWNKEVKSLNVTIDEVMKILSEFDKTSQGPDKISIDVLKKVPKWSSFLMYHVIVKSLYEGEVPIQLKCANIVPFGQRF